MDIDKLENEKQIYYIIIIIIINSLAHSNIEKQNDMANVINHLNINCSKGIVVVRI